MPDPTSFSSSGDNVLTVACVPTGINAGVSRIYCELTLDTDKAYEMCKNKQNIILNIYAPSIRDFIKLMNKCDVLVSNEGGTVHIAKALSKPTFTIFSPYVNKAHWASFEDGKFHHSIYLLDVKPDLFNNFTYEERKRIEQNPHELYKQLTPEIILPQLYTFLKNNL